MGPFGARRATGHADTVPGLTPFLKNGATGQRLRAVGSNCKAQSELNPQLMELIIEILLLNQGIKIENIVPPHDAGVSRNLSLSDPMFR